MSETTNHRQRWKVILNWGTLLALALVIFFERHQIADTFNNLANINGWALLLIVPIEALNYHAQARLYQGLFSVVGNKLSYKSLYRAALELNFVNHVFPSGGVTGMSYFSLRLRKGAELTGGKATLIHVMKLMLMFLSFELLIVFAVLSLTIMGNVGNLTVLVAGVISTLLLVGTLGFAYVVGSRRRINNFFTAATRLINRLIHIFRPYHPETISIDQARGVFDDFHDNYQAIKGSYHQLVRPFWYALLANITEVAAVYIVYIAFGHLVNVGAVILAYAVANFAGLISVVPGGIGIYEALMTAVLASAGISPAVSLPVTITYRVINTLVQLPPGYYFYHKALSRQEAPELHNEPRH
jgi:uncharacterized protein (TIRG00374 family)